MATRTKERPASDAYFELVEEFPLVHIRDREHLADAQAMIDRLLCEERDAGAEDYLDVLTDLVERFEEQHVAIPDASEADILRELMRSNALSQQGLSRAVGIAQSTLSAVLAGTRTLTKGQVVTLARHFGVAASAFMPRS